MGSHLMKWAVIVLVGISLMSAFYIWRLQNASGLDLTIDTPDQIMSGVSFDIKINFSNNSGSVLNDARLTVTLPDGVAFYGSPAEKTISARSLGNVGQGSLVQETFSIIIIAPEQTAKTIKVGINYAPASLGARFEKTTMTDVLVKSSGVTITMTAPEKVISGEDFETVISYKNISGIDFTGLKLHMEYPPSFTYMSASLDPDTHNNIWDLGDLRKNSEGKITIKGNLIGGEKDVYEIKGQMFARSAGGTYPISNGSVKTGIAVSPLSITIHLNGGNGDYISKTDDTLNYTLSYVNGTGTIQRDVVITVQLIGDMFNLSSVDAPNVLRQGDTTLVWNSLNTPDLSFISPGSAGAVNFSIKVKDAFPVRRFSDKNYSLIVNAGITSATPSKDNTVFVSKSRLETKVSGTIGVNAKAYFRDAVSGFLNQGVFPPKAGESTQFTIHWILSSTATDVSGVEVRGILGNNVKMVGDAKSNSGSLPQYNAATNEVFWQVNKMQANQGVIGGPVETVFQIEATPSASQVGNYMPLINATTIRATDGFTEQEIINNDSGITTALPDDPTVTVQGVVQP